MVWLAVYLSKPKAFLLIYGLVNASKCLCTTSLVHTKNQWKSGGVIEVVAPKLGKQNCNLELKQTRENMFQRTLWFLYSKGVVVHFDTHTFFLEERITTLCVAIITFFISESIFQSFDLLTILQEINLNMALCSCRIIKNNSTLLKLSNLFVSQQIHLLIDDHPLSWWASQVCKQLVEATTLALGSIFFSTSIRRIHPQREELGTLSNPAKKAHPCPW